MSGEMLTVEQRERLRKQMLTKHYLASILTHWFNAASWIFLLSTGLGILLSKTYDFTPPGWNELMRSIFGGLAPLIHWHEVMGQIWLFVLSFNVFFGFRKYFMPFVAHRMWMTKDDFTWLKLKLPHMLGFDVELPPQDEYNGGQKLFLYAVVVGTVVIGVTGLIMTYSELIPIEYQWVIQWAMPIHFVAVGLVFAGVIIHVYMGAVMPEERSAFFSMFTGKVNGLYAYLHHRKWYERKMAEKAAWEARYRAEMDAKLGDPLMGAEETPTD